MPTRRRGMARAGGSVIDPAFAIAVHDIDFLRRSGRAARRLRAVVDSLDDAAAPTEDAVLVATMQRVWGDFRAQCRPDPVAELARVAAERLRGGTARPSAQAQRLPRTPITQIRLQGQNAWRRRYASEPNDDPQCLDRLNWPMPSTKHQLHRRRRRGEHLRRGGRGLVDAAQLSTHRRDADGGRLVVDTAGAIAAPHPAHRVALPELFDMRHAPRRCCSSCTPSTRRQQIHAAALAGDEQAAAASLGHLGRPAQPCRPRHRRGPA